MVEQWRAAVRGHLRGWSESRIESWLKRHVLVVLVVGGEDRQNSLAS